jgi:curved DNA-binding protein CbpA
MSHPVANREAAAETLAVALKKDDLDEAIRFVEKSIRLCSSDEAIALKVQLTTLRTVLVPNKSHYAVLDVDPSASAAAIKRAYRELSRICHPDKCKHPRGEEAFKIIGEAHAVLSDPAQRNVYNMKRPLPAGAAASANKRPRADSAGQAYQAQAQAYTQQQARAAAAAAEQVRQATAAARERQQREVRERQQQYQQRQQQGGPSAAGRDEASFYGWLQKELADERSAHQAKHSIA